MLRILTTSWRRPHAVAIALVLPIVIGCQPPPGKPNPANKPKMPDQVLSFETLFANNCAGCHGADGKLGPAPPLNDPMFVAITNSEQLTHVLQSGRHGTPMPPFAKTQGGPLTPEQIDILVNGIRSHWKSDKPTPESLPPYALTDSKGDQDATGSRERGIEVFNRACVGCHGPNGAGNLHDGVVTNAINTPAFLALISDQALRRIVITGRPDLGMPTFAEHIGRADDFQPLTSADIDDLVALLADWRATGGKVAQTSP